MGCGLGREGEREGDCGWYVKGIKIKIKNIENTSKSYIFRESHRSYRYTCIYLYILMLFLEPVDISVDESPSSISSDLYIYT